MMLQIPKDRSWRLSANILLAEGSPLKGDLTDTLGHTHCLAAKKPQKWAQSEHNKTHKWVNSLHSSSILTLFLIPKEGPQIHPQTDRDSAESRQAVKEQHLKPRQH